MEQICNNFRNARNTSGLIDATSNGKKFSFYNYDVHSVV